MFVGLNNDDNNNKTGQVELSARQVNYYYFKNILVGGACPFIWKAGVCGKNTILKTLYPWQFLCSGVARGCKRLVHSCIIVQSKNVSRVKSSNCNIKQLKSDL